MSGFEIAGVVLGAIPIVIEALSAYRAGKGVLATLRKSHGLVEELIHRLGDQHWNFYLDILELLRNAQVPEILVEEVDPPPERCIEILQTVQAGEEVKQYFGPLYPHFLEVLRFHEKYLKEITSKLSHITRPPNVARDDLAAIVRATKSPNVALAIKGRARFAMDRESLSTLVKDLGTERGSLERLIRRVKTKRDWETREPENSSTMLSMIFSRVRERATSLYRAACECWVCDEHPLHKLMIRLEHRIPDNKHRAVGKPRAASSSPVAFRLCFSMEAAEMQRIEVISRCDDSTKTSTTVGFQHGSRSSADQDGGLRVPLVMVTAAPNTTHPLAGARARIRSICEGAWKAREKRSVLSLELTSCASLEMVDRNDSGSPYSYDRSVSLADFLQATSENADARMNPVEQTMLALNVVSSMLQLRPTMWCSVPWNSSTIRFPVKTAQEAVPALRTPYVEQSIEKATPGTHGNPPADLTTEAARSTMLELAILLLEILHNRSIAAWAARQGEGETRTNVERMAVATHWLDMSTSKLLPPHFRAVEGCLLMCAQSRLSWDERFQRLYCENIIKPLQELADL